MGLLAQAVTDLQGILADATTGFGRPITFRSPAGVETVVNGHADDIGLELDPNTGQAVTGQTANCRVSQQHLQTAGINPRGGADGTAKPWVVTFTNSVGATRTYKIREAQPDESLAVVKFVLEIYKL